ncbi:hypothetical protein EAE96_006936 [Botrytis aclada]|nr:hypothetical protein EAE96_006936 [Botrytis aclada]
MKSLFQESLTIRGNCNYRAIRYVTHFISRSETPPPLLRHTKSLKKVHLPRLPSAIAITINVLQTPYFLAISLPHRSATSQPLFTEAAKDNTEISHNFFEYLLKRFFDLNNQPMIHSSLLIYHLKLELNVFVIIVKQHWVLC